ncbi:hypothetical protein QFZ27_003368 [Inquilinus ginsengisoli]|uniref:DUF6368 family protein n=1 Tax=Inquilinus ginsengisoli TaxID=363840 RepID=UPI003D1E3E59
MAGPTLEILLWQPFSADRVQLLRDLVAAVTCSLDEDPLQVVTTRPLGGSFDGNFDGYPSLPFLVEPENLDGGRDDLADIEAAFGCVPLAAVGVCAMTKGSDAHRVLAELALAIAERLDGVIDFNGLLLPNEGWHEHPSWEEIKLVARPIPHRTARQGHRDPL